MVEINTIEEIKERAVKVLLDIDDFCRKNDIKYFLAYGTLIGAVRHNGFIPWDDDIDIMMPRPDYEKFNRLYNSEKFGKLVAGDKDYVYPFTKVYDKETQIIEKTNVKKQILGIYVDIFPLDGLPPLEEEQRAFNDQVYKIKHKITIKYTMISKSNSILKNILLIPAHILLAPFKYEKLAKEIDIKAQAYSYDESENVACLVWNSRYSFFPKAWYKDLIDHDFEGHLFPIPSEYDKLLTFIYGDYMTLPPEEQRVFTHGYKVFKK